MEPIDIFPLLDKYIRGTATPEEEQLVDEWYRAGLSSPAVWISESPFEREEVKDRMLAKIQLGARRRYIRMAVRRLAVAALAAGAGVGIYLLAPNHSSGEKYISFSTGAGEIRQLTLSDGSKVWLNAGSTLRYKPSAVNEVYLTGEAYFDVVHDKARTFTVHSGDVTTTDLGTQFDIRASADGSHVSVALEGGKVSVSSPDHSLSMLEPGQELLYDKTRGESHLLVRASRTGSAWKEGKLEFNDLTLTDITDRLAAWYGVRFVFKDPSIGKHILNATFDNKIPLDKLLTMLCAVTKIQFSLEGTTIVLSH